MSQSFTDASLALESVGDTSGLVPSDYGYHIIKLIAIRPRLRLLMKSRTT